MSRSSLLIILALSILFFPGAIPKARALVPPPPEIAVNHQTRQCAIVVDGHGGCFICSPPEGWEILGWERDVQCPAGYQLVDLQLECKPARNLRCCLPGHTGARGDCAGVALDLLLCCSPVFLLLAGLVFLISRLVRSRKRSS